MKEYYTIGELSKIYHFPVSTLRYYHRCGLFEPEYRDPSNGYRYYSRDQLYKLDALCLLRVLDIPVADIVLMEAQPDFDAAILEYLTDHRTALEQQVQNMRERIQMIDSILSASEQTPSFLLEDPQITIRHFPARKLILKEASFQPSDEREIRIYMQQMFGTPLTEPELPTIISGNGLTSSLEYLLRSGRIIYDGVYMIPDGPFGRGNWTVMEQPECDCLTLRYLSDPERRKDAYARIAAYIKAHNVAAKDMMMEEMLWHGLMSTKKGSDVMELRVILE